MMDEVLFPVDDELETVLLDASSGPTHPLESDFAESNEENGKPGSSSPSPLQSFRSPSGRPELLIEPPSYADVVYTPYNGKQSSRERDSRRAHAENFLKISVSAPQKVLDGNASSVLGTGGASYVTYLITTFTDIPEFQGTSFSARRRFRDVVALADKLGENYKGYFIPVRPEKNLQLMQGQEFVEQRREDLEKYFSRLAAHPVLRKCPELREFFKSPGQHGFDAAADASSVILEAPTVNGNGVAEPVKGNLDLFKAFKELRQYVVNDWGGTKPLVVEDDKKFLERKEKIQDYGSELIRTSDQAETLVKAQEEIGKVMGNLGISLSRLGDQAAVDVGNGAVKASRCYTDANTQCMKHLDTLHEYLALMQAIHGAFNDRSKALLHVQMLKSEIASLQARHEKLTAASLRIFGGDRRKVEESKAAIASAEAACAAAEGDYERIKERNWEEIQRYEAKREVDMFDMLKGFVETQVGYAEKLGKGWSEVLSKMNG